MQANDGVCDEGRPLSGSGGATANANSTSSPDGKGVEGKPDISQLLCDLGTDCNDCGPWSGTVPSKWWARGAPAGIHLLKTLPKRSMCSRGRPGVHA